MGCSYQKNIRIEVCFDQKKTTPTFVFFLILSICYRLFGKEVFVLSLTKLYMWLSMVGLKYRNINYRRVLDRLEMMGPLITVCTSMVAICLGEYFKGYIVEDYKD